MTSPEKPGGSLFDCGAFLIDGDLDLPATMVSRLAEMVSSPPFPRHPGRPTALSTAFTGKAISWRSVRYATFARTEREMRRLETANRFLTSGVDDGHCAYPTQKQALNALTFFLRHSCGVGDPVFDVKLKRAN